MAPRAPSAPEAILPALVNAHTHLELSWMRGRIPPADSMPEWAERLVALRRTVDADPFEPIVDAIREARAFGTALVGDIGNTAAAYEPLTDSELSAVVFRELLGFSAADPADVVARALEEIEALTPIEWLRPAIAPHAPYSVSPALLQSIARAAAQQQPLSIHLGESRAEIQFLCDATGPWRDLLERLGVWNPSWRPPGCGPVEYLDGLGIVNERLLAVHGVQLTDDELSRLAAAGATVVTCPRSNRWTGAGEPPVERFYRSGVRVAVGTDSLAGVEDLNVFAELAVMRRLAPGVPARRLLRGATIDGAEALGFGPDLGSIERGKRGELVAVRVPDDVQDVEEYLVGGIGAGAIRWLESE
ncbi:MAG TPA: amidohydrolase family protein [Vicinamibacterales bacterium]|nr:amidohydrolase family protein [Vicinamibacterales bacterium]